MIQVIETKNYKIANGDAVFSIGEDSPLANPFQEYYDELGDELMHIAYRSWFDYNLKQDKETNFNRYLRFILIKAESSNIVLGCDDLDKSIHAEVIKNYIERSVYL
jgi:hypothetical protein